MENRTDGSGGAQSSVKTDGPGGAQPLLTKFTIKESDADSNDIGTLFQEMYPGLALFKESDTEYFCCANIDADAFLKFVKTHAASAKSKREDKALETQCKVIKYKGNYYLVDGTTRIPLFDD